MAAPPFHDPKTPEEFLSYLPPGLRAFIDRELAAGNRIAQTGTGFPAAPVGVWIVLAQFFKTSLKDLPEGVVYRTRPHWTWPAECTDLPRHSFVLPAPDSVAPPEEPRPEPPVQRSPSPPAASEPTRRQKPKPVFVHSHNEDFGYADMFDKAGLERRVSETIAKHLGLMFDQKEQDSMRAEVGEEGLALVREINDYANRPDFWQNVRSTDGGYQQIQRDLATRYSFLSRAAIERLATRAAWGWR